MSCHNQSCCISKLGSREVQVSSLSQACGASGKVDRRDGLNSTTGGAALIERGAGKALPINRRAIVSALVAIHVPVSALKERGAQGVILALCPDEQSQMKCIDTSTSILYIDKLFKPIDTTKLSSTCTGTDPYDCNIHHDVSELIFGFQRHQRCLLIRST